MMEGKYSENLKSGGELLVSLKSWSIRYYFPGPDRRYNGTFVYVQGSQIDDYIKAWTLNFQEYLKLKKEHTEGQFQKTGILNMGIRIGGYNEGVCIDSYHMPIRTQERLEEVLSDYRYAAQKANAIMYKPDCPISNSTPREGKMPQRIAGFSNEEMVVEYFGRLAELESKVAVLEKTVRQLMTLIPLPPSNGTELVNAINTSDTAMKLEKTLSEIGAESAKLLEKAKSRSQLSVKEEKCSLFSYEECSIAMLNAQGVRIVGFNGFEESEVFIPAQIDGKPVISIGNKVFINSPVKIVKLPDTVLELGESCFEGCKQLSEIIFSNNLMRIGKSCFSDCANLHTIVLPSSLNELGSFAFSNAGIRKIVFPERLAEIPSYCCSCCVELTEVIILEGVGRIGSSAFQLNRGDTSRLQRLLVPKTVTNIGVEVFENRDHLQIAILGMETKGDAYSFKNILGSFFSEKADVILYVKPGSEMHRYAQEHKIKVKPLTEFTMD